MAPRTVRDSGSPWSDSDFADLVLKRRILDWLFDMEKLWESRWFLVSMLCLGVGRLTVGSRVAVGCGLSVSCCGAQPSSRHVILTR